MNDMSGLSKEDLLDAQTSAGPSISAAGAPTSEAKEKQAQPNTKAAGNSAVDRLIAYDNFLKAMQELLAASLFVPALKYQKAHQICGQAILAGTQLDVLRNDDNTARAVVLKDLAKKSSIGVLQDRVAYQSPNPAADYQMADAMKMAWLAAQNKDFLEKGVTLEGSARHKRMLQLAIQAVNETLPPEQRLEIKNPVRTHFMAKPDFRAFVAANSDNAPVHTAPAQATASPATSASAPSAPAPAPTPQPATAQKKNDTVVENSAPQQTLYDEITTTQKPHDVLSLDVLTSTIENLLDEEGFKKATATDRKVDKTGAFPFYNVYAVPMELGEGAPDKAYYVMKNKKPVIIGLDMNGQAVMRDADIFMKNDAEHPKNKAHENAQSPVAFSVSDIMNASVNDATYKGDFPVPPAPAQETPTPKAPAGVEGLAAKMMAQAASQQTPPRRTNPLILGKSEGTRKIDPPAPTGP